MSLFCIVYLQKAELFCDKAASLEQDLFVRKGVTGNTHIKKGIIKTEDTMPDCPAT